MDQGRKLFRDASALNKAGLNLFAHPALSAVNLLNASAAVISEGAFRSKWLSPALHQFSSAALSSSEQISPSSSLRSEFRETRNKLHAFHYFTCADAYVRTSGSWSEQTADCRRQGSYSSIWLLEGIGARLARASRPGVSLRDLADVPNAIAETRMALHTGAGTIYAREAVQGGVRSSGERGLNIAIEKFLEEAGSLAYPGYRRFIVEALGLVVRNLHPELMARVSNLLASRSEEDQSLFWHGSGRGFYFNPLQLMPVRRFRHWILDQSINEAPNSEAVNNLVAGFFWALTLVNVRNPEVVADFLRRLPVNRWTVHTGAICDGVSAALLVWEHLTREDRLTESFIDYLVSGSGGLRQFWVEEIGTLANSRLLRQNEAEQDEQRIADLYSFQGA